MQKTIILNPISTITAIKISMRCPVCGHTWAVFLDVNFRLPVTGDKCLECAKKKSEQVKKAFSTLER